MDAISVKSCWSLALGWRLSSAVQPACGARPTPTSTPERRVHATSTTDRPSKFRPSGESAWLNALSTRMRSDDSEDWRSSTACTPQVQA